MANVGNLILSGLKDRSKSLNYSLKIAYTGLFAGFFLTCRSFAC